MLSSTVFVVDVSSRMHETLPFIPNCSNFGSPAVATKLELALQGIENACQFLALHHPWETVAMYICADTFRPTFPPGDPAALRDQVRFLPNLVFQKFNWTPQPDSPARYAALLEAARAGTLLTPGNTAVVIFTENSRESTALKLLRSYPESYQAAHFLPAVSCTPVVIIDLSPFGELGLGPPSDSLGKFLSSKDRRCRVFTVTSYGRGEMKALCDRVCRSLYAPWKGTLTFNGRGGETVCIFPNPWGLRGARQSEAVPAVIDLASAVDASTIKRQRSWILPVSASPVLWHTPNGCDPSVPTNHTRPWSPGSRHVDFKHNRLCRNFTGEQRTACGGNLCGAGTVWLAPIAELGFEEKVARKVERALGSRLVVFDCEASAGSKSSLTQR